MLKTDGSVPQMSLFKHKRVKGWWPFAVKNDGEEEMELTVSGGRERGRDGGREGR
jgi:hypothetical protein